MHAADAAEAERDWGRLKGTRFSQGWAEQEICIHADGLKSEGKYRLFTIVNAMLPIPTVPNSQDYLKTWVVLTYSR